MAVLFTPTDSPHDDNFQHLESLHAAVGVPSAYLLERHQGVTHSFGSTPIAAWLHFLCKAIKLQQTPTGYRIEGSNGRDNSWLQGGWHLSYTKDAATGGYRVLLLTSGQFPELESRLQVWLLAGENLQTVQKDPYALWIPALMEAWKFVDDVTWGLVTVFGGMEAVRCSLLLPIKPSPREMAKKGIM